MMAAELQKIKEAREYLFAASKKQFEMLVTVKTGIKHPPPWLFCALAGMPYYPRID